jgi:hypothetical protein
VNDPIRFKMDLIFSSKIEDTPRRMSTPTQRIDAEIEALHYLNVNLAKQRKYQDIDANLAKISSLEFQKSKISKIKELRELMTFLNSQLQAADVHNPIWEHREHMCFNGQLGEAISTYSIDRKLFKIMFEAIEELNKKIDELTHKVSSP